MTACGGSNSTGGNIQGAQSGPASASPTPTDSIQRPTIRLPSDLKLVFEGDNTGDPVKDAVLRDNEDFIRATHQAIALGDPNDKAYQFYAEGQAGTDTYIWIKTFVDAGVRSTGTARYYKRVVSIGQDGWATIGYCEDQSKAYGKDLKTGKVEVTPVTKNSYVSYAGSVRKNSKGIWVAEKMVSVRGDSKCQP